MAGAGGGLYGEIKVPNPAKPEPKRFRLRRELLAVSD